MRKTGQYVELSAEEHEAGTNSTEAVVRPYSKRTDLERRREGFGTPSNFDFQASGAMARSIHYIEKGGESELHGGFSRQKKKANISCSVSGICRKVLIISWKGVWKERKRKY